jgi:AsmA protein
VINTPLLPPRLQVQNLSIADDPEFNDAKPFVEAQGWDVSVKLLPLLSKSLAISSLSLQRPSVELIKGAQGTWNFSTIGATQKSAASQNKQQFSLGELAIQDGQIGVTDQQARNRECCTTTSVMRHPRSCLRETQNKSCSGCLGLQCEP